MNIWHDISPESVTPERFTAVIEIPKGGKNKYEIDKETGMLRLDRVLFTATNYPANYGFIPLTYADDQDPLDVLVMCQESIVPMTLVECYPIGIIKMIDEQSIDEKIIAIPFGDPSLTDYDDISDLPKHTFEEYNHFFTVYKELESKTTFVKETRGRESAIEVIEYCIEQYKTKFGDPKER